MSGVRPDFVSDEPDKGKSPPPPFAPDESDREAEAGEGLSAGEVPAPPVTGVEGTIPRHPLQEAGPVAPSPLGPDGGRVPTEVGEEDIDELTR